jgi:hypothetical protein
MHYLIKFCSDLESQLELKNIKNIIKQNFFEIFSNKLWSYNKIFDTVLFSTQNFELLFLLNKICS